jgi:PPOX class probable FMN-dependent enzyme
MNWKMKEYQVADIASLEALYDAPTAESIAREVDYIHPHHRAFIEAAPFAVLATGGPGGLDVSPRGDPAGFIVVEDAKTLLIPDRRGSNRLDSLRNIVIDPRVALLFLIPGVEQTLRVNGRALISIEPALLDRFRDDDKPPRSVIIVHVEKVYLYCSRALQRSNLWNPARQIKRDSLPSADTMLATLHESPMNGATRDHELPTA